MDEAKVTSQMKLVNQVMGLCSTATACTTVEVIGALELVKSQLAVGMVTAQAQAKFQAAQPPTSLIVKPPGLAN